MTLGEPLAKNAYSTWPTHDNVCPVLFQFQLEESWEWWGGKVYFVDMRNEVLDSSIINKQYLQMSTLLKGYTGKKGLEVLHFLTEYHQVLKFVPDQNSAS